MINAINLFLVSEKFSRGIRSRNKCAFLTASGTSTQNL